MLLKKSIIALLVSTIVIVVTSTVAFAGTYSKGIEEVPLPTTPEIPGGFTYGASFLFLQPSLADGDNEYGSLITLTPTPPTLRARLQKVEPNYQAAMELRFGYQFANSHSDVNFIFSTFNHSYNDSQNISTPNQIIQNYLGDSFMHARARTSINFQQYDLNYGHSFDLFNQLYLHPTLGLRFIELDRDFRSSYQASTLNPLLSANLVGDLSSDYNGIGPVAGVNFNYPLFGAFSLSGAAQGSLLNGHLSYNTKSHYHLGNTITPYIAKKRESRHLVAILNTTMALRYTHPFENKSYALITELGYQISNYGNAIGRLNPLNGFANNPAGTNPPPQSTTASLGFNGPFIRVALEQMPQFTFPSVASTQTNTRYVAPGFIVAMTNIWQRPWAPITDLGYATVHNQFFTPAFKVRPRTVYDWAGRGTLGYVLGSSETDIQVDYTQFDTQKRDRVYTGFPANLTSVSASGPAGVYFAQATSFVQYHTKQIDLILGKYRNFKGKTFHAFAGIRGADIVRKQNKAYSGGQPPTVSAEKFPRLTSEFTGVGPLFGIDGVFDLYRSISFVAGARFAALVGDNNATLKQSEVSSTGIVQFNHLTSGSQRYVVPAGDIKLGLRLYFPFANDRTTFNVEGGFQASGYYRAINLLYPTFRTGLEQSTTTISFSGPYLLLSFTGV